MTQRLPQPVSAARILREALEKRGLTLGHAQSLDVVARLYGHNSWHAMQQSDSGETAQLIEAGTFRLSGSALTDGCHFEAGNLTVTISGNETAMDVAVRPQGQPNAKPLGYAYVPYAEAAIDRIHPDPSLPFFGCELPLVLRAIELVSKDNPNETRRIEAEYGSGDDYVDWLETGMPNANYDLSEELISAKEPACSLSGAELLEADLASDGRFTLKDGRMLYLLDQHGKRWAPLDRV